MKWMVLLLIVFNIFLLNTRKYDKSLSLFLFSNFFIVIISLFLWEYYDIAFYITGTLLFTKTGFIINGIFVLFSVLFVKAIMDFKAFVISKKVIRKVLKINNKYLLVYSLFSLLSFMGILLRNSSIWAVDFFDGLRIDQMIYTLSQPLKGTDPQQILEFVRNPLLNSIVYASIFLVVFYHSLTYRLNIKTMPDEITTIKRLVFKLSPVVGVLLVFLGINKSVEAIGKEDIKKYFFETTSIYEDYYVEPLETKVIFSEKKNLIYIMLESMESSYTSEEFGGYGSENLMPRLTQLAMEEGVHFSHNDELGGAFPITGTNQTVTGTVAQTAGVPVRIDSSANAYGEIQQDGYLPGAYSLGEILEEEGYEQMYFIGSDAGFAGRDNYFTEHGNYEIRDLNWLRKEGFIPPDYYEWWGVEDEKLYDFAKESLVELANRGKPFNFTMLTTNTHFPDGYFSKETEKVFDEQYSNVIHHADKMVYDFINWIKQQEFYEDTVIVVVGDHLSMDKEYFVDWEEDYKRTIFNLYLNTDKENSNTTNREFTSLDFYPTTLAAMSVEVEGNRLGLGVNLFSGEPTIVEEIGLNNFSSELLKRSKYYRENILLGTDIIN